MFWLISVYLRDYFLTDTAASSCGCQVIDREPNESNTLSDVNTLSSIIAIYV